MKTLTAVNIQRANQQGFTIIELVVVILLLGILTATALPRFMNISDQAHAAVVDAVEGGLSSGVALFKATYTAEGEQNAAVVAGFGAGTLFSDAAGSGYPADATDGIITDGAECGLIYDGLLQSGRPVAFAGSRGAADSDTETLIEANAANVDFIITEDIDGAIAGCELFYVGQFKSGTLASPNTIPTIVYKIATGIISSSTFTLQI